MNTFKLGVKFKYKNGYLYEWRIKNQFTEAVAATYLGIDKSTYSEYENLKLYPSKERREKIAQKLGVQENVLFPDELRKVAKLKRFIKNDHYITKEIDLKQLSVNLAPLALPTPSANMETEDIKNYVQTLLHELSPQGRLILQMRYGIGGYQEHTHEEIGNKLRMSRERIRQLELKILGKLQKHKKNFECLIS